MKKFVLLILCSLSLVWAKKVKVVEESVFDIIRETICEDSVEKMKEDFFADYPEKPFNGYVISLTGRCVRGYKHGTFNYYADEVLIMKTKYHYDEEVKNNCVSHPQYRRISQKDCIDNFLKKKTGKK